MLVIQEFRYVNIVKEEFKINYTIKTNDKRKIYKELQLISEQIKNILLKMLVMIII